MKLYGKHECVAVHTLFNLPLDGHFYVQ